MLYPCITTVRDGNSYEPINAQDNQKTLTYTLRYLQIPTKTSQFQNIMSGINFFIIAGVPTPKIGNPKPHTTPYIE